MMNYVIRDAVIEDYKKVNALVKEVHDLHVQNRPNDYKDCKVPLKKKDYKDLLLNENVTIFVAESLEK